MGIKQNKLLAIFIVMTIILYNCQGVISYAQIISSSKDESDFVKNEDTAISVMNNINSRNILGEEITYEGKERSVTQKPYITRISKSQMVIGNYYKATINIYGQAKYGTTVYANIGSQESSQKIGSDQTFGFTVDTIRQSITIEFYAVGSNGSKSESVFVTCTPNGDYITGNGTYPTNNKAPVIKSNDKVFNLGQVISESMLLKDVTAYDEEDGDLTSKVKVKSHDIHSNSVGTYSVIYEVTDSEGETTEKENKVKIIDPNSSNQFEYTVSGDSVTIEGYNGVKTDVVIPDEIEGYPVVSIAYGAFKNNKNIVSITIPNGITQLNGYTFSGCTNLETVKLPDSLIYIYDNVFSNCIKLKNINIPSKVKLISVYTFKGCVSLEKVDLPENIEEIGYSAFSDCIKLKNINIPSKVNILQRYVFSGCKSLIDIDIPDGLSLIEYGAFYGCDNLNKVIVPQSVEFIGDIAFSNCSPGLKIYGYKNSYIEQYAKNTGLTFVYIKETNTPPTITAYNLTVDLGQKINLMEKVSASDYEDGDITSKVKIVENTVDTTKVGKYKVVYSVEDSDGNIVKKEITVTVRSNEKPVINAKDITINLGDKFDAMLGVSASDKEDGDLTLKIKVVENTVNILKAGKYKVVYSVTDSDNNVVTIERLVTVNTQKIENVKAAEASYNSNKITWNRVSGANGYVVYRSTSKNGTYKSIKTITNGDTLSYTNSSLATGTTYYYKVRAYRTVDGKRVYSKYSSIVSAKPTLSKPNVTLTAGTKKATVKWKKISGASGYEVYRASAKSGKYTKVKTITKGSTVSYTNSSLTKKKTYYYKVRAYRLVNGKKVYSSYSSIKYVKVK